MENRLAEFLMALAQDAKKYKPFLAEKLRLFEELKAAAAEKKPTGGATSKARQALQKLRNALLGSTHHSAAKHTTALLVQQTGKDLSAAIEKAVQAYGLHEQARLEHDLHKGAVASEYRSREQGPGDEKPDVLHFVNLVGEYGVSPNMLGRLKRYQGAYIGRLLIQGSQDRNYEQADNDWALLFKNGFLNAYRGELSEDESRALNEVAAARSAPDIVRLQERFESRFGALDLTPGFKAACQRLLKSSAELTDGEAQAMFDASGAQRSVQSEYLRKVLGISFDEMAKVDAFVRVMEDPTWLTADGQEDLNRRLIVNALLLHFNDSDAQGVHPSEWLPSLSKILLAEDGFIARHVPSEAAFWSLVFAALELSTFRGREETRFLRQRKTADQATREALSDFYQRNAMAHHFDEDGVPWLGGDNASQVPDDLDEMEPEEGLSSPHEQRSTAHANDCDIVEAHFAPCELNPTTDPRTQVGVPPADEGNRAVLSSARNSRFEEFE